MSQLIPPSSSLPDLPPTSVRKTNFLLANKRPILSFGGALLIGYILTPFVFSSQREDEIAVTQPLLSESVIIPASSVMLVKTAPATSIPITGEVKMVANVTGKAPVSGAVARWLVEPGQKVEKGQGVVEISSGAAVRAPLAAEASQSRAEKMQINAANDQLELASKLSVATSQLRLAKERVANAQEKVSEARSLIKRLQNGENVVQPAKIRTRVVKRTLTPEAPAEVATISPEEAKAQAALKLVQRAADAALASQKVADTEVKNVERSISANKTAIKDAEKRIKLTEDAFEQGKVSGADVYESRAALEDANAALKVAEARTDAATREAEVQQKKTNVALAQVDAAKKALALAQSQNKPRIAVAPAPEIVEEVVEEIEPPTDAAPSTISIVDASKMAEAALAESQDASRAADRLATQVASYRAQAHASNNQITEASNELMQAQQQVLDSAPRPRFTVCEAPNDGTIVWISRLASEVGTGDNVFGVSSGNRFTALMKVDSPSWKTIKIGQLVSGSVGRPHPTTSSPMLVPTVGGATFSPVARKEASLNIKVTKITPPTNDSPALVEGDIDILAGSSTVLNDGKLLAATLPTSEKPGGIRVPEGAILKKEGRNFVAILTPQIVPDPTPTPTPANVDETAPEAAATSSMPDSLVKDALEPKSETYLLQWRQVEVGAEVNGEMEIRSGVQMGTRIVSDILSLLPQIELDPKSTSSVTVAQI